MATPKRGRVPSKETTSQKKKTAAETPQVTAAQRLDSDASRPPETSLQQAIRTRAYELWEQRGGADGSDLDDWLRAESEISRNSGLRA